MLRKTARGIEKRSQGHHIGLGLKTAKFSFAGSAPRDDHYDTKEQMGDIYDDDDFLHGAHGSSMREGVGAVVRSFGESFLQFFCTTRYPDHVVFEQQYSDARLSLHVSGHVLTYFV